MIFTAIGEFLNSQKKMEIAEGQKQAERRKAKQT